MHHALINADVKIGRNCIVNSKALVEHDVIVEDNCHISTGAIINGGTVVKENTFFRSNAMAKEYIEIKTDNNAPEVSWKKTDKVGEFQALLMGTVVPNLDLVKIAQANSE